MRNRKDIENDLAKVYSKFQNLKKLREIAEDWEIPYIDGDLYKLEDEIEALNSEIEEYNHYTQIMEEQEKYDMDYYVGEEEEEYYDELLYADNRREEERQLQEEYESEDED